MVAEAAKKETSENATTSLRGTESGQANSKFGIGSLGHVFLVLSILFAVGYFVYLGARGSTAQAQADLNPQELQLVKQLAAVGLTDKPKGDRRTYQYTTLPNGLQVLNVRDPNATQVAFSVAVDAGSLDNPKNLPGLAHFCEHMLFLGTNKFPEPSGFDDFISSAGGYNNAFTADEHTVYFFEVAAHAVDEGLSRFGDFFRAPLFNDKYVEKEVNAIDSEHAKNVQDQNRRTWEIFMTIANPKHPMTRFKTGNLDTLGTEPKQHGIDPVNELKSWFTDHYCPSRMRLVTFGAESLDKQLVRASQNFADIPAGSDECQKPRRSWSSPEPWPQDRLGRLVAIQGNEPHSELWLHFPLPDISQEYAATPMSYINYVTTYGGEQSLSRVLHDKLGLVTSLSFSGSGGSSGYNVFVIARLTTLGTKHYEVVLDLIFQYLATLKSKGVDEELYKSLADISALEWDWSTPASPADTASGLAETMINIPMPDLLTAGSLTSKPNSTLVADLLSRLHPGNMNVGIVDPHAGKTLFKGMEVDELAHYDTKFALADFHHKHPGAIERWGSWLAAAEPGAHGKRVTDTNATDELFTSMRKAKLPASADSVPIPPRAIRGVPSNLNLDHMHAETQTADEAGIISKLYGARPTPVADASNHTPHGSPLIPKFWYRSGWVSESPKVNMHIELAVPRSADSWNMKPDDALRLSIYSSLLGEEMNPKMYDFSMTGVSYGISFNPHSISFSFSGFAPMMPELMDKVLNEFDHGVNVSDSTRYERIVQELNQSLHTFSDMPISYAIEDRNLLLTAWQSSRGEQIEALNRMTSASVGSSLTEILMPKPMQITGLAVGNMAETDAMQSFSKVQQRAATWSGASAKPAPGEEIRRFAPVVRPGSPVEIRRLNQRPGDLNDAAVISLLVGVRTVESRVIYGLLSSILHNAAYSELRTNRQLGYVVSAGISSLANVHYVSCVVQGQRLNADELEGAIEYVYSDLMPRTLANMTDAEFDSHKSSLEQQLLTPPSSFNDEFGHFWSPISEGGDCFNVADEMLEYLREAVTSKEMLAEAWDKILNPEGGVREKVVVKHFAKKVPKRPSLSEARASWAKQGAPKKAVAMLQRERAKSIVLHKADSATRAQVIANGTYFPTDLNCRRASHGAQHVAPSDQQQKRKHQDSAKSLLELRHSSSTRSKKHRRANELTSSGVLRNAGQAGFLHVDGTSTVEESTA